MILEILADPVVPTSKLGSGAAAVWAQYGMIAISCALVGLFVIKVWGMLMKHPLLFLIIAIIFLAMVGAIKVAVK